MTITITQPTQAEIKADPRAYAVYKLMAPGSASSVDAKTLEDFAKKYGEGKPVNVTGSKLEYSELAKLLKKAPSTVEGQSGNCLGWAAHDESGHLTPFKFDRPAVGASDVAIQIVGAGICHSDLHQITNDWKGSSYPMVPGHEIAGVVTEVGSSVKGFKVGEHAGIGCYIRACESCTECKDDSSQYCSKMVVTYNGKDWGRGNSVTHGGYSTYIVVHEDYVLHVPANLPLDAAAPLLCAGITVWSPMHHYGLATKGQRLGVMGLGGLGHMAVKFGKALGMEVTVISTSPKKEKEAREVLKADHFLVSKNEKDMLAHAKTLDGVIDTVSAPHELSTAMGLLRTNGKLILLGVPNEPYSLAAGQVIFSRLTLGGSLIGSIKETQEMLDFCGEKNITCEVEKIPIDYVNTAMDRLQKNDVHYRFSIDIAGTLV